MQFEDMIEDSYNIISELGEVHLQLAEVLEEENKEHPLDSSALFTRVDDLRECVGNIAVAIDNITEESNVSGLFRDFQSPLRELEILLSAEQSSEHNETTVYLLVNSLDR